ncbi:MAG: Ig-like domain-containing protein, partial [Gammaproteobacteria bacterium]
MRTLNLAAVLLLSVSLVGCFSDKDSPDAPRNTGSTGLIGIEGPNFDLNTSFRANWQLDPATSVQVLPYPNDIAGFLASPSSDGTLNLAVTATQPLVGVVNQLDGFSTNARMTVNFSEAVDPGSLTPASVFIVEVALDRSTRAVIGLSDQTFGRLLQGQSPFLVQGVEYEVEVAS